MVTEPLTQQRHGPRKDKNKDLIFQWKMQTLRSCSCIKPQCT